MSQPESKLWWQLEGEDCAAALVATCDRIEKATHGRVARCKRNLSLFEGRAMLSLSPDEYYTLAEVARPDEFERQRLNITRAIVNAAVAKVGGKQRPKTQFVVNCDDWSVKRRAKRLERVVEATMLQRHAALQHQDAWSVGLMCLRDAATVDCGVLKWTADRRAKRVVCSRVLPWELHVDPYEAKYGAPRNLFHVYGYDRFLLADQFPKYRDEIMAAPSIQLEPHGESSGAHPSDLSRLVKVREGWRLPSGSEDDDDYTPGRHSIVVGRVDLLDGEEWTRDFFPFEILVWEPWFQGIYGTSIADNVAPIADELNAATERWATAERLGSNAFVIVEEDSVNQEDLESNSAFTIVKVKKSAGLQPQVIVPQTIGQASIVWNDRLKQLAYEISGQSQMAATGQVDQGVTAAIAMRTQDNIATERFSWQWRMFESVMAVGCARQIVACLRELAEEDPDFALTWPGGGYLREIKWEDADLDDDKYVIQPYAVSGLVNSPTDRLNLASDLFDKGILSRDSFLRVIQYKNVDDEISSSSKQSEYLEQMIEQWLDADVDRVDVDPEYTTEVYWPPEPFLNLQEAIVQVGRAYFQARMDKAPDPVLQLFLRFLADCNAQLQKQMAQQAQMKAMAIGHDPAAPSQPTPEAPPAGAMPNG